MSDSERIWVVDRIESGAAVLVADKHNEILDIPLNILPDELREGSVLRVAEDLSGPLWASASLDEESRLERLAGAEEVLDELRQRDPGGDIVL